MNICLQSHLLSAPYHPSAFKKTHARVTNCNNFYAAQVLFEKHLHKWLLVFRNHFRKNEMTFYNSASVFSVRKGLSINYLKHCQQYACNLVQIFLDRLL